MEFYVCAVIMCIIFVSCIYYPTTNKKEILLFAATWMNLGDVMLSEVSQTQEGKYTVTYMWALKVLNS